MGENGAGKSTLIKVLTGVYKLDGGEIYLDNKRVYPSSTLDAQKIGISSVYQEVNLCDNLTVAENISFAVSLLPEPNKPEKPTISPLCISKDTGCI